MKKKVLILCGGRSEEHEISLISATHILKALDRDSYEPLVVGISKSGTWYFENEKTMVEGDIRADQIRLNENAPTAAIVPFANEKGTGTLLVNGQAIHFDAAFPILHGQFGEDGTLQGLLDIIGVPYVGAGCTSSAICMDKSIVHNVCEQNGVPMASFVFAKDEKVADRQKANIEKLGFPVFVKPSRQGSSVGVSKVSSWEELEPALKKALEHDRSCLIERAIVGRELECAVLGLNGNARVAPPGEIVPNKDIGFYSYEGKYLLDNGAQLIAPAKLTEKQVQTLQALALVVFDLLDCDGMARVDMFLEDGTGKIYLNEVNTIPGFTPISMYPKLWQVAGLSYPELVSELILLAFERNALAKSQ